MKTNVWHLEGSSAKLKSKILQAQVELNTPFLGLSNIRFRNAGLSGARALQIQLDTNDTEQPFKLIDCFVRGNDLVAVYDLLFQEGLSLQTYWRFLPDSNTPEKTASVELILSLQNLGVKSDPYLYVSSSCIAEQILTLVHESKASCKSMLLSQNGTVSWDSTSGTSLFLARLTGTDISYAQMVHPTDFVAAEAENKKNGVETVSIRHQLFGDPLEKGVIRCVRTLGFFLPREDDLRISTDCYRQLTIENPPLTA